MIMKRQTLLTALQYAIDQQEVDREYLDDRKFSADVTAECIECIAWLKGLDCQTVTLRETMTAKEILFQRNTDELVDMVNRKVGK